MITHTSPSWNLTPFRTTCEQAKDRSQHRAQYAAGSGGDLDLHSAIAKGSFPLVRDLLAQGVPIDTLNTAHMTPLHAAVDADNYDIVELLLQRGAEPNAVSKANGETPIHLAKSPEIAELLINNKANMDARDEWLLSPLHHAAKSGLGDVVAVLLQHGARVDYYDGLHRTPLIVAAFSGHKECVEELASNGANLAAKDKSGRTALDLAKAMGHTEVHKLLAEMTKLLGDMGGDAQSLRALPAGSPARLQRGSNNLPAQRPPSSGLSPPTPFPPFFQSMPHPNPRLARKLERVETAVADLTHPRVCRCVRR